MAEGGGPSGAEDARLVGRARDGDRDAFERLVRRHLAVARGLALAKTGDIHQAEDVCQDAFVAALERLEQCRKPERFRSWLLAIVRNTALNALDRERRRPTGALEVADELAGTSDPARDQERRTLRKELGRAMERLPEMQRKVLLLHDYEGWTHAEIGRELEIASGTSRYHLHVARGAMRELMGGGEAGPVVEGLRRGPPSREDR